MSSWCIYISILPQNYMYTTFCTQQRIVSNVCINIHHELQFLQYSQLNEIYHTRNSDSRSAIHLITKTRHHYKKTKKDFLHHHLTIQLPSPFHLLSLLTIPFHPRKFNMLILYDKDNTMTTTCSKLNLAFQRSS